MSTQSSQVTPASTKITPAPKRFAFQEALDAGYTPKEITDWFVANPSAIQFRVQDALKAGYSPDEIVNYLRDSDLAAKPASSSLLTALRNGAGQLISGLGNAAQVLDKGAVDSLPVTAGQDANAPSQQPSSADTQPDAAAQGLQQAGQTVSGPAQYQPLPNNSVGNVLHNAAGVVAQAAPSVATGLIPGAAPVLLGASAAGNTIASREAQKGETQPSTGDLLAGLGSSALNTALGATGTAPAGSLLRRAAANAAIGGGTGAANYALANPNGTAQGALQAAGQGAALGAGLPLAAEALPAAGSTLSAAKSLPVSRAAARMHPEQAASIQRVGTEMASRLAAAKTAGSSVSPSNIASSMSDQLNGGLSAKLEQLRETGAISDAQDKAIIQPALSAAKAGVLHSADANVSTSALAQFDNLNLPADDAVAIRNGLIDLSTLARDGKPGSGLQGLVNGLLNTSTAHTLESLGGAGLGFIHGGGEGAVLGGIAGAALPKVASAVAGGIDRLTGADTPPVLAQQAAARLALQQAGVSDPGNALANLQASVADHQPPAAPTPDQQGQQAAARNQAAMVAKYGPDHPVGAAAALALAQSGNGDATQRAMAQWNANQPVRDAAPVGKAWDAAAKHQLALDTAQQTPGGGPGVGIDAINAAQREAFLRAQATQRLAGNTSLPDSVSSVQAPAPSSGPATASTSPAPSSDSTNPANTMPGTGLQGLKDYLKGRALWRGGTMPTDSDIQTALNTAASSGALSPDQYGVLLGHIQANTPLHHVGGAATPALEAVLANLGAAPSTPVASAKASTAVRDAIKYSEGAKARQATYDAAAAALQSEGYRAAAQAVQDARHLSNGDERAEVFSRLPPIQQARVRALIGAALYGR